MLIEIIDDNISLSEHLRKSFEKKGHKVKVYNSRGSFLHSSSFYGDLFIMDIDLGDGNGLDLIEHLRKIEGITAPIIIISGNSEETTKSEGFDIGADEYLEKPFTVKELYEKIEEIFQCRGSYKSINTPSIKNSLLLSTEEKNKIFKKH